MGYRGRFDFDKLNEAGEFISSRVKRLSGCTLIYKEKWGTLRYEHIFAPYVGVFSSGTINSIWINSRVVRLWERFGWYILKKSVDKACKLYPTIAKEIREDLDGITAMREDWNNE